MFVAEVIFLKMEFYNFLFRQRNENYFSETLKKSRNIPLPPSKGDVGFEKLGGKSWKKKVGGKSCDADDYLVVINV